MKENELIEKLKKQKKDANARYRKQQQTEYQVKLNRERTLTKYKQAICFLCEKIIELSPDDDLLANIDEIKKELSVISF